MNLPLSPVCYRPRLPAMQGPLAGRFGSGKAGPSRLFEGLPDHLSELSMPDYEVWRNFMTEAAMTKALKKVDLEAIARLNPQAHVVDIGSGYGDFLIAALKGFSELPGVARPKGLGIDIMPSMIQFARDNATRQGILQTSDCELVEADVLQPDGQRALARRVPDGSVGLVILSSMFHMPDSEKAKLLAESYRMLAPGGRILLTHWFKGFKERGPEDAIRPMPDEIARWALDVRKSWQLEFAGYEQLTKGLFAVVLEKPKAPVAGTVWNRLYEQRRQEYEANSRDEGNFMRLRIQSYLTRIAGGIRHLNTPAEAYIFMEGLIDALWEESGQFQERVLAHTGGKMPAPGQKDPVSETTLAAMKAQPELLRTLDEMQTTVEQAYQRYDADPLRCFKAVEASKELVRALRYGMMPAGDGQMVKKTLTLFPWLLKMIYSPGPLSGGRIDDDLFRNTRFFLMDHPDWLPDKQLSLGGLAR